MADIILRDREGNPMEYIGVERINVPSVGGETAEFVDSEIIPDSLENVPIDLDFSSGDQTITAPDGTLVKSAIIKKPETLISDNIANGVNIAGIVGTLVSGGAGGSAKWSSGTFVGSGSPLTVEHGLGVAPDLVIVSIQYYTLATTNSLFYAYGVSGSFGETSPGEYGQCVGVKRQASNSSYYALSAITATKGIENTGGAGLACIHSANDATFSVGVSGWNYIPLNNANYTWVAVGGLS